MSEGVEDEYEKSLVEFFKKRKLDLKPPPPPKAKDTKTTREPAKPRKPLTEITEDGKLLVRNKEDKIRLEILIPKYRPTTSEEIIEMETARLERIAKFERNLEKAKSKLHNAIISKSASASEIVRLNREIAKRDANLFLVRYQEHEVLVIDTPMNQVDFSEPEEKRVLHDISCFYGRPINMQDYYVRNADIVPAAEEAVPEPVPAESKKPKRKGIAIYLPDTNEYGYMSLEWPVAIIYNGTTYKSAKHALFGELAKEFKRKDIAKFIQKMENPIDIKYTYDDFKEGGVTEKDWDSRKSRLVQDIIRAKFVQHPELVEKLLETGNAFIAVDIPNDPILGIGLAHDHPYALRPSRWIGENLVGKTLEGLRSEYANTRSREEEAGVAAAKTGVLPGVTEAVTSAASAVTDAVATAASAAVGAVAEAGEGLVDAGLSMMEKAKPPTASAPEPEAAEVPGVPKSLRIKRKKKALAESES